MEVLKITQGNDFLLQISVKKVQQNKTTVPMDLSTVDDLSVCLVRGNLQKRIPLPYVIQDTNVIIADCNDLQLGVHAVELTG